MFSLGSVTMSLKDITEKKIRRFAKEKFEDKKGAMAKVVAEAVDTLEEKEKRKRAHKRLISIMEKGFDGGKILVKHRSELYTRK